MSCYINFLVFKWLIKSLDLVRTPISIRLLKNNFPEWWHKIVGFCFMKDLVFLIFRTRQQIHRFIMAVFTFENCRSISHITYFKEDEEMFKDFWLPEIENLFDLDFNSDTFVFWSILDVDLKQFILVDLTGSFSVATNEIY